MKVVESHERVVKPRRRTSPDAARLILIGARLRTNELPRYQRAAIHALGTNATMAEFIRKLIEDYATQHKIA